jgi:hypothetical protein
MPTNTVAPRTSLSGTAAPGPATGRVRSSSASKGHTIREVPAPEANPDGGFVIDVGPAATRIRADVTEYDRPK